MKEIRGRKLGGQSPSTGMITTLPYHVHVAVLRIRFLCGKCPCSSSNMTKQRSAWRSHISVICLEHVLAPDAQSFASSRLFLSEKTTTMGVLHLIPKRRPVNVKAAVSYKSFIGLRRKIIDSEITVPVQSRAAIRAVNRPERKSHLSMPNDPCPKVPLSMAARYCRCTSRRTGGVR